MALWAHRLVTKMEMLTLRDATARLAEYLLAMAPAQGDAAQTTAEIPVPKQTLAAQLAISSETLSRLLTRFEAHGLIEVSGRRVKVLDRTGLRQLAELGRV